MPQFYELTLSSEEEGESYKRSARTRIHYWKPVLALTFLYYVTSCGIEKIYQSMVYVFRNEQCFYAIYS
jgi:hypothetical protein